MPFAAAAQSNRPTMTDQKDKRESQTGTTAANPRQERLKRALRENLKRRKTQARGRSDPASAPSNGDHIAPYDGSGKKPGE
jgi:hypothetical protein